MPLLRSSLQTSQTSCFRPLAVSVAIASIRQEKSEAEAHTTELVNALEATEEAEGYTGDKVCTVCETVVEKGQTIPVISNEPTQAPTEAPAQDGEPQIQGSGADSGWLLWVFLGLLVIVVVLLVIQKPWKK